MLCRLWIGTILYVSLAVFLTNVKAQSVGDPYRLKDEAVERIICRIEVRADHFRSSLDAALDKHGYKGTRVEQVNTFIERFYEHFKQLRDQFDKRSSSTSDVRAVLDGAAPIDEFMARNRLSSAAQNDWTGLRNKLDQLAIAYDINWRWDTYRADESATIAPSRTNR
jgi:hypothetical protein